MRLQVEDPPEIESMDDEVLLNAWRDKTMAEINELVRLLLSSLGACEPPAVGLYPHTELLCKILAACSGRVGQGHQGGISSSQCGGGGGSTSCCCSIRSATTCSCAACAHRSKKAAAREETDASMA